jgi:RNA polymerase sigma-70 factor, ECF subfamily
VNVAVSERAAPLPVGERAARRSLDEKEFEAFYRENARPLWGYLCRIARDASLADDLLQSAFYQFLRSADADAAGPQLRSYLYRIATNLLADHWRRARRESLFEQGRGGGEEWFTAGDAESRVRSHEVGEVFRSLGPKERALLWLVHVEGAKHEEIAAAVGVATKSVKVLLYRARRKLAAALERRGLAGGVTS